MRFICIFAERVVIGRCVWRDRLSVMITRAWRRWAPANFRLWWREFRKFNVQLALPTYRLWLRQHKRWSCQQLGRWRLEGLFGCKQSWSSRRMRFDVVRWVRVWGAWGRRRFLHGMTSRQLFILVTVALMNEKRKDYVTHRLSFWNICRIAYPRVCLVRVLFVQVPLIITGIFAPVITERWLWICRRCGNENRCTGNNCWRHSGAHSSLYITSLLILIKL